CVREEQLGCEEVDRAVDLTPVPSPVQQHRALRAGLQVMLLPQDDLQCEPASSAQRPCEQRGGPRTKQDGGSEKRRQQLRVLADGREERKTGEAGDERERQETRPPSLITRP